MIRPLLLASLAAGQFALSFALPSPAQSHSVADICPVTNEAAPARQTRTIRGRYGINFRIPANYRTMATGDSSEQYIAVFNPSHHALINCMKRNRISTGFAPPLISIHVGKRNGRRTYFRVAKNTLGGRDANIRDTQLIEIGKQVGLKFIYERQGVDYIGFLFLSPDSEYFALVSYYPDSAHEAKAERIINSFSFPR